MTGGDPSSVPAAAEPSSQSLLLFRLDEKLYALQLRDVAGVEGAAAIRPVPGAAWGILGLSESGGHILTVLDLPGLLGHAAAEGPACLVRLAEPLEHCALYVPAAVRVDRAPLDLQDGGGLTTAHEHEEVTFHYIAPRRLLAAVETQPGA